MRLDRAIEKFLRGYFATRNLSDKTYKAYAGDLAPSSRSTSGGGRS